MTETLALVELAERAIKEARRQGLRLVTVESCTAGALSTLLADIPGAGDALEGGFVSYAKSFKSGVLGVSPEILTRDTAVSESVAVGMARGALIRCPTANVAIAVTGVCGPKPDEDGNAVGLAYVAVAHQQGDAIGVRLDLDKDSSGRLRGQMISAALSLLLQFLSKSSNRIV